MPVNHANLTSLEETRQLVDWKAQAGLLSQLDQDQARQSQNRHERCKEQCQYPEKKAHHGYGFAR